MNNIILCIGMPRAGSTLQFNIIYNILKLKFSNIVNIGYLKEPKLTSKLKEISKDYSDECIYVIKSHYIYPNTLYKHSNQITIFSSYRDLRDSYLSAREKWNRSLKDFLIGTEQYIKNQEYIEKYANPLVQSYETMYYSLPSVILNCSNFLNFGLNQNELSYILGEVSMNNALNTINQFTKQQKLIVLINKNINKTPKSIKLLAKMFYLNNLLRLFIPPFIQHSDKLLHPDHISKRKGEINGWKTHLKDEEIKEIEQHFKNWLRKHGYKTYIV